jgi:signal transduction histidine kinase
MVKSVVAGYEKEGVQVVVNIDKGTKVKADRIRFRELLDNLISNAFKYTDKGQISIEAG